METISFPSHPRDSAIDFTEESHTYTYRKKRKFTSVTTLIHKYFPQFDAEVIIPRMMASPKWNTSKYYGMTAKQIKAKWQKENTQASSLGTTMHKTIEAFLAGEAISISKFTKEMHLFLRFWREYMTKNPTHKLFRIEWWIYGEDVDIAGAIDIVMIDENGDLYILDWKRSKEIKFTNDYEVGYEPFDDMDNCNANHYFLQLNFYRHIIMTKYGYNVKKMKLVILHPQQDKPIVIMVPRINVSKFWAGLKPSYIKSHNLANEKG